MDETTRSIIVGTLTDGRAYILLVVLVFKWIMALMVAHKIGQFHAGMMMEWLVTDVVFRVGIWVMITVIMAWVTAYTPLDTNKVLQEAFNNAFPNGTWVGILAEAALQMGHKYKVLQGDPEAIANAKAKNRAKYFEQGTGVT